MWWGLSISLTKEGEEHVAEILAVVYQYLQVGARVGCSSRNRRHPTTIRFLASLGTSVRFGCFELQLRHTFQYFVHLEPDQKYSSLPYQLSNVANNSMSRPQNAVKGHRVFGFWKKVHQQLYWVSLFCVLPCSKCSAGVSHCGSASITQHTFAFAVATLRHS